MIDGRHVDLELLELYIKKSDINLNSVSAQMFRLPPDGLTHQQGNELFALLFEAAIPNKKPEQGVSDDEIDKETATYRRQRRIGKA
jgi:hypothetical protein